MSKMQIYEIVRVNGRDKSLEVLSASKDIDAAVKTAFSSYCFSLINSMKENGFNKEKSSLISTAEEFKEALEKGKVYISTGDTVYMYQI